MGNEVYYWKCSLRQEILQFTPSLPIFTLSLGPKIVLGDAQTTECMQYLKNIILSHRIMN